MITIETRRIAWQLDEQGITQAFKCTATGTDLADTAAAVPFCRIARTGGDLIPLHVDWHAGRLQISFADGIEMKIAVEDRGNYLVLRMESGPMDGIDHLVFLDVPLRAGATTRDDFTGAAVALNTRTRVDELPGPQNRLLARCYPRFGVEGAAVALVASPFKQMRGILKEVVNAAPDLPKSPLGGPWALDAPKNFTSYLFGVATEDTVDEWIALCHEFGMDQLHFCGHNRFRYGDYRPDPKSFPNGMTSARNVVARLHKAGIMAGIHTMSFSIEQTTPYVTPVPDKRLATEAVYTLADAVSADTEAIPLMEDVAGLPKEASYHIRRSMTVRIDDELIDYTLVNEDSPRGIGGCRRGAWGTCAAPHAAGAPVHHLSGCWGKFAPDGESSLFSEIAGNIANAVNECGFDMIYMDGLDGIHILGGEESRWHYGGRFAFEVYRQLKQPVIMEMAAFLHHLWFLRSRMGAWDHPIRGFTPFMDHHVRSNRQCRRIFLPAHLGWWAPRVAQSPSLTTTEIEGMDSLASKNETTHIEDVEYLCTQALASNAGFSLQGVTPEAVRTTPHLQRLAPVFKRYAAARSESETDVSSACRENSTDDPPICRNQTGAELPSSDQTDRREDTPSPKIHAKERISAASMLRHTVTGLDDGSGVWQENNPGPAQPVKIRIEALWSAAPYDHENGIALADFQTPDAFKPEAEITRILNSGKQYSYSSAAPGMRARLTPVSDTPPTGPAVGVARFEAMHQGDAGLSPASSSTDQLSILDHGERIYEDRPASWAWLGKKFGSELDLTRCPALGFWVHGDASDAVLNVQVAGPYRTQAMEDHYVPLDFKGWRYVALIEPESDRFEQYAWPYGRCVYDIYRNTVQYDRVAGINLWLNNVPADGKSICLISKIRALPLVRTRLSNPVLRLGDCNLALPFELTAGDWLEIMPDGVASAFAPDGREIKSVKLPGKPAQLAAGANDLAFNATVDAGHCRARVTVISKITPCP